MDLRLAGKRVLVTGSSAGTGAEIAMSLAQEEAYVIVHGRDQDRTEAIAQQPRERSSANQLLTGKVAFITGAARGIGRAIAELFAANGANIAMLDIADPSRLNSTKGYRVANMTEFNQAVAAVKRYGTKVVQIQVDVRDLVARQAAAERTNRELGGIDIVVANAGYCAWHSFEEGTPQQWNDVYDVNVHGVFNTAKVAIPFLKQRSGGRIINLASVGGRAGFAGNGAYTSSKWAVIGMTKQAAQELGKYNIAVNANTS
ncbi:putative 2-keto-3-deoxygluconate dehydrogenase [Leptolyngbya sp. NIES-3755]|nr:putative 2-keto-3-deoxygluconate dehydrogenase [Leptolyngbya sp. NIES-3755]